MEESSDGKNARAYLAYVSLPRALFNGILPSPVAEFTFLHFVLVVPLYRHNRELRIQ